ncbi:hypothetical protein [Bradyrhizobium iriomotense]|uniref:hypothetical protein n=1 Tax=Bradyrhizobium iriomotense TaxID=441950 RepID=UPI001B8A852E|nr:hypothetical protein [Bradyrhizobium iriomotense]MBR0781075.1 hypothetical protein [Bradyrhizobium iriomotense]
MIWKPVLTLFSAFTLSLTYAPLVHAQSGSRLTLQSLEAWKVENAVPDGKVSLSGRSHEGYYRAYACPRFDLAEAVVAAIPDRGKIRTTVKRRDAVMAAALHNNNCVPAKGLYRVTAVGHEIEIDRGSEAQEYWTALTAVDASGRTIGLVFDSSPFAITD